MKLDREKIIYLLNSLNEKLATKNERAEIYLLGGAVMCLLLKARDATQDLDAIFLPTKKIRPLIKEISEEEDLPESWINDAVKGFISENGKFNSFLMLSNLDVFTATPEYILAMKCLSMRIGEEFHDLDDVRFLLRYLNLQTIEQVLEIIQDYYPLDLFPVKTKFALKDLLPN